MSTAFYVTFERKEGETWRQAVARTAAMYGLERECLDLFDADMANGIDEKRAAFDALWDWDCLPVVDEPVSQP